MARHGAPAIAVVGNDACWSQVAREQVKMLHADTGCMLAFTPYHKIGEAYAAGSYHNATPRGGFFVDAPGTDEASFRNVIAEAKQLNREGIPVVLNCRIAMSTFREGSISV